MLSNPCSHCGKEYNYLGRCENCGLVDNKYLILEYTPFYPYDEEKLGHHGDPKTEGVSDISMMTTVSPIVKSIAPDLKRAITVLQNKSGWTIVKMEILKKNMKNICFRLGLNKDFLDSCYKLVKMLKDFDITGKSLENIAPALVYLLIRLSGQNLTLYDFKTIGYDTNVIYRNYADFIIKLHLYKHIKPQEPTNFIMKFVNSLIPEDPAYYKDKRELILFVRRLFLAWLNSEHTTKIVDIMALNGNSGLYAIGACMYVACKKDALFKTTQAEISRVCGCSEVTLREYVKKLKNFAEKE